jgi:4-amino-4-deoxy-L-arabinose transferase-like glycosyltransferase
MFFFHPLPLLSVLFGLVFACPWALLLLGETRRSGLLVAVTTLALSVGGLTWSLMLLTWLGAATWGSAFLVMLIIFVVGLARSRALLFAGFPKSPRAYGQKLIGAARQSPVSAAAVIITLSIAGLFLLNAIYWPFGDDDAISIYAVHSLNIYQKGHFNTGIGLYEAYPMLVPLSYVYAYLSAGEVNEYLARIFPAMLAVGTLGAAAALGQTLYNRRSGLIALLLLALTPAFVRWAPTGYTDIPAAFFVTLAALFAWRLAETGCSADALLAGMIVGLAAWTKNSTLSISGSLLIWLIGLRWQRRITTRQIGVALSALLVMAGPWYARNLLLYGLIVPDTAWTDRAVHTLSSALPFLTEPSHFFLPGIVFTAGLAWALVESLRTLWMLVQRRDLNADPGLFKPWLLLIFALPFMAAWWWFGSYEVRFLVTVLPLIAVMGGRAADRTWEWVGARITFPLRWRTAAQIITIVLLIGLALPSARKALIFKDEMLRDPLMTDYERHRMRLGAIYDVALYLNALPAEGRVLSDTYFLPFHARTVTVIVGGLPRPERLGRYTYLVYSPGRQPPDFVQPDDIQLLTEIGGYRVYWVVKE